MIIPLGFLGSQQTALEETVITTFTFSETIGQVVEETVLTSVNLGSSGDSSLTVSAETDLEITDLTSGTAVVVPSTNLDLQQTITAWNPIAIVTTTVNLASSGSETQELEALVHAFVCTNSRSKALGAIPSNHPGA